MNDISRHYGRLPGRLETPAVRRLTQVAEQLGDRLRRRVVFIGASLLPLMETEEHVLSGSRATDDVDAVTATTSYGDKFELDEALRAQGFRNAMGERAHVDRWRAPNGVIFDCVSCGSHLGGTGSADDLWVIDHAVETDLPPPVRHASAVGLLLLKSSAYQDRGASSPITSKDLSDIAAMFAARPQLVNEVAATDQNVRETLAGRCRVLLESPRVVSAIRSHISSRQPLFEGVDDLILERMRQLTST